MVKILAALTILNSSGASPGATEKVAALVARATCSGASHSSDGTWQRGRGREKMTGGWLQCKMLREGMCSVEHLLSNRDN